MKNSSGLPRQKKETIERNINSSLFFRLPGQYFDQETGLHYNYFRFYDPKTGRYLTPDPIGIAGGINPFLYSWANPINLIDPNGLEVLMLPGGGGVQSMTPMDLGFRDRSPDYYAFTFNLAVRNTIAGAFIGWSGQAEIDRYGNLYTSPLGSS